MKQKIFAFFAAASLLLGLSACTDKNDNPVTPSETDEALNIPELEIDPSEFQPIDVSVALLGSLSNYAEEEAVKYWFTDVHGQVTDKSMVVITDEITAANEEAILTVLNRYGMLLLVDPKEDNVRKYGEYFGVAPDEDYSKVELLGLTGLGDQFVSYVGDTESASEDPTPTYIAGDDIWDVAPAEYLRLKAFAEWVDRVVKKYDEYQKELADNQQAIDDAIAAYEAGDEASARRTMARARTRSAMTRSDGDGSSSNRIDINTLRGIDKSVNLVPDPSPTFESYDNAGRSNDKDVCPLSVTVNYSFKPLYEFPKGNTPGADYYIVETSVNWDCSETLKGFKQFDHGEGRDRRSYLFFPIECQFYSEPFPTRSNYSVQMVAGSGGDLKPDNVKHTKSVTNERRFSIDANVSGGINKGKENGTHGTEATSNNSLSGNANASLGIGASWSKTETFTVEEYDVAKIVNGQKVGHTISVPGGEDGYRPRMVNKSLDKGFEVSGGVNFRKTLSTNESWVWKVSGTSPDTDDSSIKVKFTATPTVSWSSYFHTYTEWGVREHSYTMSEEFSVPAPNRRDAGLLNIKNTGDEDGKPLAIFGVRAIDVTDPNNTFVAYENLNSVFVLFGDTFTFGLPANRTYDIELEMGRRSNKAQTYHLDRNWMVTSIATTGKAQDLVTDMLFSLKPAE